MRQIKLYILFLAGWFMSLNAMAQLPPPVIHCLSVNAAGNVIVTWEIPPDPSNLFTSYQVFCGSTFYGAYAQVGTVNVYNQTTYLDASPSSTMALGQSMYYYLTTTSNSGANVSIASDTLRTIHLSIGNSANGKPPLTWNHNYSYLSSASNIFKVSRQALTSPWTVLYTGPNYRYTDTISVCSIFYNYQVETSDAMGCISQSNISGDVFHDGTPPNVPFLDSASVNPDGTVTLGWEASTSPDAARYVVYLIGSTVQAIDTINGRFNTSYTYTNTIASDTGSQKFAIAALDSCNKISLYTQPEQSTIFLSVNYDFCGRTAKLSWNNYGNLPQGISKYNVYCSVNGGAATLLGTTSADAYSQPNLNPGDTYCYSVKVINNGNAITANSNVKCITATSSQGPTYVYIRDINVNSANQVEVSYDIDNNHAYKGATIYRSLDGITFNQIGYQPEDTGMFHTYVDKDVSVTVKNYYYKIQVSDSCGNAGVLSNISKTILLKVSNDNENIYFNTLTWDDYSTWLGGVESYNIYRAVNGIFNPVPISNVPYGTRIFVDNVEEFTSDNGKFSYYVEAVEGLGNMYGYKDVAKSNAADAYVEVTVFVPNAFCPNGLNNIWLPVAQYVEKTDYKVAVFNRWGTKVFQTSDDTEGWDGKGTTDDVFVYLIEYKNARGEFIQLKGYVNLIR